MIEAAMDIASRKSSAAAGSGTSITKMMLIAASGSVYSRSRRQIDGPAGVPSAAAAVLMTALPAADQTVRLPVLSDEDPDRDA